MGNWWFDNQGRNNLSGIPGDPDNPAVLPDDMIVNLLTNIPIAKQDFYVLVPLMPAAEQVRLRGLVARNPATLQPFPNNDQDQADILMAGLNKPGVHDPNNRRKK